MFRQSSMKLRSGKIIGEKEDKGEAEDTITEEETYDFFIVSRDQLELLLQRCLYCGQFPPPRGRPPGTDG